MLSIVRTEADAPGEMRIQSFDGFEMPDGGFPVRMKFRTTDGAEVRLLIDASQLDQVAADMRAFADAFLNAGTSSSRARRDICAAEPV